MRAAVEAAEREDAARKDAAKIAAENGPGARLGDPFVALTSSEPPRCSVVAASAAAAAMSSSGGGGAAPNASPSGDILVSLP